MMKFVQIVENVLSQNDAGRLEKFQLKWLEEVNVFYANKWASYAIAHVLNLELSSHDFVYIDDAIGLPLPGTLFTSDTLEKFRLAGSGYFKIEIPCDFCLPKLQVLILDSICYGTDVCLSNLIAGCPMPHSLTIVKIDDGNDPALKISSPSLRYIDISYYDYYGVRRKVGGKIEIDVPALESLFLADGLSQEFIIKWACAMKEVRFDLELYSNSDEDQLYIDQCNLLVGMIQALESVKLLELTGSTISSLSNATTPLSTRFDRLTKLTVGCYCCRSSSLNAVLGCCSKLEVLDIRIREHDCWRQPTHKECWKEPEEVPIWLLCSLKEVSFDIDSGLSVVCIAMIRYILQHGTMMKTLKILSFPFDSNSDSLIFESFSHMSN